MRTLHLPDEIVAEILSRLPVKSLLRFRCVSKSWRRLLGSKQFIKNHLDISRRRPNFESWQVIFLSRSANPNFEFKRCSLSSYWYDDPSVNPLPIDDPINDHLTVSSEIIGHSNGLLCIYNKPMSLLLWNPATRISVQLPELDCCSRIIKCGIGWDGESDVCKLFAVFSMKNKSKIIGSIYSSETNSWKAIEEYGSVDLNNWIGEFVCGRLHWIVGSGWIETFDLKNEVFGRIELPEIVDGWFPTVDLESEIQECLNLVYCDVKCDYAVRRIWEMKKYGVDDSWVSIRLRVPRLNEPESTYLDRGPTGCYVESLVLPVSDNHA